MGADSAGLVLGDGMRLEAAMAVTWHLDGQLAEITLEVLFALAVAGVAAEQSVLADEVFRLLVVDPQARQQFFGYVVFLGAHGAYGQAGLRRQWIVRLHKILHTLATQRLT